MKCKVCGSELSAETVKCPYCGTLTGQTSKKQEKTFDWSESGSRKKPEKKNVSIDWDAGKIIDNDSGQVYSQEANAWSEPEEVKDLFSFDARNEEYQKELDRQMDSMPERPVQSENLFTFDLPSSMDMGNFDDLINDTDSVDFVNESGEVQDFGLKSDSDGQSDFYKDDRDESEDTRIYSRNQEADATSREDERDYDRSESSFEIGKDLGNVEVVYETPDSLRNGRKSAADIEEGGVASGLRKLMETDQSFVEEDVEEERILRRLTHEEAENAAIAEEKSRKLASAPEVAFRSLEDEYADYCDANNIPRAVSPSPAYTPASKHGWGKHAKDKNKGVEIKINEASGTKVTVKTQEISLNDINSELAKAQTREVDMDQLVNAPKNVQVSVEVSAAQGNASVEVTRRHDGATVVKTLEQGADGQEHVFQEGSGLETGADLSAGVQPEEEDASSFWEKSDSATRMTITDIFGPEARKILEQIDKAYNGDEAEVEKDLEDSLIMDINPEDIAITPDQTAALYSLSPEAKARLEEEMAGEAAAEEAQAEEETAAEENAAENEEAAAAEGESGEAPEAANEEASAEPAGEEDHAGESPEGAEGEGSSEGSETEEADADVPEGAEGSQPAEENPAESDGGQEAEAQNSEEAAESGKLADEQTIQCIPKDIVITNTTPLQIPPELLNENADGSSEGEAAQETEAAGETAESTVEAADAGETAANEAPASEETPAEAAPEAEAEAPAAAENQASQSEDTPLSLVENTKPQKKVEKAMAKEAARQKKRAEKAQKKLLDENKKEKKGLSGALKFLIVILALCIIAEFGIIFVKLYAPDSQTAVFIERIEDSVAGLIHGGSGGDDSSPDSALSSEDGSSQDGGQTDASDASATDGTAAPADTAGTDAAGQTAAQGAA